MKISQSQIFQLQIWETLKTVLYLLSSIMQRRMETQLVRKIVINEREKKLLKQDRLIRLENRTYGQSEETNWNTERCSLDRQTDRCVRGSAGSLYACTWLRLHSCKKVITNTRIQYGKVRYSTVQYGTEGLPGPALLLPDRQARKEREREKCFRYKSMDSINSQLL